MMDLNEKQQLREMLARPVVGDAARSGPYKVHYAETASLGLCWMVGPSHTIRKEYVEHLLTDPRAEVLGFAPRPVDDEHEIKLRAAVDMHDDNVAAFVVKDPDVLYNGAECLLGPESDEEEQRSAPHSKWMAHAEYFFVAINFSTKRARLLTVEEAVEAGIWRK